MALRCLRRLDPEVVVGPTHVLGRGLRRTGEYVLDIALVIRTIARSAAGHDERRGLGGRPLRLCRCWSRGPRSPVFVASRSAGLLVLSVPIWRLVSIGRSSAEALG